MKLARALRVSNEALEVRHVQPRQRAKLPEHTRDKLERVTPFVGISHGLGRYNTTGSGSNSTPNVARTDS